MGLSGFPSLLSGPIVRRVEPEHIYIWAATSQRVSVEVELFEVNTQIKNNNFQYIPFSIINETKSIQVGERLFVHLVKIRPRHILFPTDTLLGYNLLFKENEKKVQYDLGQLGLLSPGNSSSIVYGNLRYPTFTINSKKRRSNILYGSCRKIHGEFEDALAAGDTLIDRNPTNITDRPDTLILMGDQIYADDVAGPIFHAIHHLSSYLIGKNEPLEKIDSRLSQPPFSEALNQTNGRQYIMENFCRFTSNHAQNHLMKLGEYSAMYLLTWSPEVWKYLQQNNYFHSFKEEELKNLIYYIFPNDESSKKEHKTERKQLEQDYEHQQEDIITFQCSLNLVRRLLANIPTYMIFDDHDITDDWNITFDWKQDVYRSSLGRHVIANGLSAYWLFQGWGNDPESFDSSFIETMESYFGQLSKGTIDRLQHKWSKKLWEFNSWNFVAPTVPKAVFLDTRTQRTYDIMPEPVKLGHIIREDSKCAQLLSQNALERITMKLENSGWKPNSRLIVISPTPVYGMGLIESFLHDYVYPLQVLGIKVQTSFDFEAWKYNSIGFTRFLKQIGQWNPSTCIVLSGDVHYASAVKARVTLREREHDISIEQYTSSPLKNSSFIGIWGFLMRLVVGTNSVKRRNTILHRSCNQEDELLLVSEDYNKEFLWKDTISYQTLKNGSLIETKNNLGLLILEENGGITSHLIKIRK